MATQKAIVMQGGKKIAVVHDRAIPRPRPGYIGVRVKCIALNPTDWKHADFLNTAGCLLGCDYAGVVESLGDGYSTRWKIGDRIFGLAHGGNRLETEDGAFAQHIMVRADCQMRIAPTMSFEQAASLGLGIMTCGQGLFQALGLQQPTSPITTGEPILIYGGSTATGTLGIQLAKLAGYIPITTCAPANFGLVKSLGAAVAFDYRDSSSVREIREQTSETLGLCWDTISLSSSANFAAACLQPGGRYSSLLPVRWSRQDVEAKETLVYTAFGEKIDKGALSRPSSQEDFKFAQQWAKLAETLLAEGKVIPHPIKVMPGGIEDIPAGLDLLRKGKISRQKIVYRIDSQESKL